MSPEVPFAGEPDTVVILVDEHPSARHRPHTTAPTDPRLNGDGGLRSAGQSVEFCADVPVRKPFDQGHFTTTRCRSSEPQVPGTSRLSPAAQDARSCRCAKVRLCPSCVSQRPKHDRAQGWLRDAAHADQLGVWLWARVWASALPRPKGPDPAFERDTSGGPSGTTFELGAVVATGHPSLLTTQQEITVA